MPAALHIDMNRPVLVNGKRAVLVGFAPGKKAPLAIVVLKGRFSAVKLGTLADDTVREVLPIKGREIG